MKKGGIKFVEIMLLLAGSFILAYSLIPRIANINSMSEKEDLSIFVKRLNEASTILWSKSLRDGYNGSIRNYSLKEKVIFPQEINKNEFSIQKCGIYNFNKIYETKKDKITYIILCKDGNTMSIPKFKLICVEANK